MSKHPNKQLHKDFDLERLILFSDAVFAIAITLLIIEIKFPEVPEGQHDISLLKLFKPTIIQYIGFILSFFFIGNFWARHLRLFRLLIAYDSGVIALNLLFLFFIVSFPFTASGITEHIHPGFLAPVYIYMTNIALVILAKCLLCNYIFYKKPYLTVPGHEAEKRYIYRESFYNVIMMISVIIFTGVSSWLLGGFVSYAFLLIPVISFLSKRKLKKLKKAMKEEQAIGHEELIIQDGI
jgi:uncharacterized membrane protein